MMRTTLPLVQRTWKIGGPILLSVLSLFLTFVLLQPLACAIDPAFTLLSNRSIGKIAFTVLVMWQIILFIATQSADFIRKFLVTNFLFFRHKKCVRTFSTVFVLFFLFHLAVVSLSCCTPFASFQFPTLATLPTFLSRLVVGFIATFFLAWTEELIFRGTLYLYFVRSYVPLTSALLTSAIFSLSHRLTSPLTLVTTEWRLGLGLFLLGLFLNLLFIITNKLYVGMGAHAGLVYLKVVMRRLPFVAYTGASAYWWWLARDLREAHIVHFLFLGINILLIWKFWGLVSSPAVEKKLDCEI